MTSQNLLLEQLSTNSGEKSFISRREMVRLLGLGALLGITGCKSVKIPGKKSYRELDELNETVLSLRQSNPALPGFNTTDKIALIAFPPSRGAEDARILAGRLYLDALQKVGSLKDSTSRLSRERVQAILSGPIPTERFTKTYFDELLSNTKARMRNDRAYRDLIADSAALAQRQRDCECNESLQCWVCGIIVIIIIIIIIVL